MTHPTQSAAYREAEVLVASPGRLVVITFDALLKCMERARIGIAESNYDILLPALEQSQALLGDLLVTLDRESGGEIARRLAALYAFVMTELLAIATTRDVRRLERNMSIVRELRGAFAQEKATHTPQEAVA